MEGADEVRINHKISGGKFVEILKQRPRKVVIPASVLKQSKVLSTIVSAIETSAAGSPDIEVVERGKPPRLVRFDPVDPFVRRQVGYRPNPEDRLLVHLLDSGKPEVPIPELAPGEIALLPGLVKSGRVTVTGEMKVRLTKLGAGIARGAKGLYEI